MTDLIERLEKEGGSRELDARVEVAALTGHCWIKLPNDEHRLRKGQVLIKGFPEELTAFADAKPVTTSLDAAIALCERVLSGWSIELEYAPNAGVAKVELFEPVAIHPNDSEGYAHHPATALCIALLRALEDGK